MNKKPIVKLIVLALAVFLLIRFCTSNLGSVITLPGGMGGNNTGSEESGGWFSPKNNNGSTATGDDAIEEMAREVERELGIGKDSKSSPTSSTPSSQAPVSTTSTPLTFKGIPITGSLQEFGKKLVNAGFRNAGSGVYSGDFAGYTPCKITPIGNNPVYEVRVDFPVISDWNALEKAYDSLQASLTQKYGIEPVVASGSNVATYNVPGGTITLDADVREQASWHVILKYTNQSSPIPSVPSGRNPIDDL